MKIKIKCKGHKTAKLDELIPFQGKLKTLSEENKQKLCNRILAKGFTNPINVWLDDGQMKLIDGHARVQALTKLKADGHEIPPLPICTIEADSYKDAKEEVLAHSSAYNEMTTDGLLEFTADIDLGFDEINDTFRLKDVDLVTTDSSSPLIEDPKEKELDENIDTDKECPSCGYKW